MNASTRVYVCCLALSFVARCTVCAQQEKWADPPFIQLSKNMTRAVSSLPRIGSIKWQLRSIPFVDKSPRAGISGAGMVAVQGKIYLVGGFIPAGDGSNDRASRRTSRWAYCYETKLDKWQRLPNLPTRREYTRAIAAENAVYVVGGSMQRKGNPQGELVSDQCFKLDLADDPPTWKEQARLSVARTHMGVGRVGGYLIVAGGVKWDPVNGYHSSTMKNTTDVFDLSDPKRGWKARAAIPGLPRGWCASATCGEWFYLFSGLTFDVNKRSGWVDECLKYHPASNQWKAIAKPPVWVSGWEAATYRQRYIIVVGGCVGPTSKPYSNGNLWNDLAFVYDTEEDRWALLSGTIPPAAVYNDSGVVIIGDTIFVAGGEGPRGSHFNHFAIGQIRFN